MASSKEAAEILGIHWVTLFRWIKSGSLWPPKLVEDEDTGVQRYRWTWTDIERARAYKDAHGRWPDKERQEAWKRGKRTRPTKAQAAKKQAAAAEKRKRDREAKDKDPFWGGIDSLFSPSKSHDALVLLGLQDGATAEEVKGAYRELAKLAHPDRGGNAELMAKYNAAYALLEQEIKK
jgi:hypothetical protein